MSLRIVTRIECAPYQYQTRAEEHDHEDREQCVSRLHSRMRMSRAAFLVIAALRFDRACDMQRVNTDRSVVTVLDHLCDVQGHICWICQRGVYAQPQRAFSVT